MLVPGTNVPIQVTFDSSVASFKKIVATLWQQNKQIKKWERDDMTVSGMTITLPLKEDETKKFKKGKAKLEIKGLNGTNQTVFWEEATIEIGDRRDKDIDLIEGE